ncbi:hypothetical protein ACHAXS_013005 [Conticribra weissflogii]
MNKRHRQLCVRIISFIAKIPGMQNAFVVISRRLKLVNGDNGGCFCHIFGINPSIVSYTDKCSVHLKRC